MAEKKADEKKELKNKGLIQFIGFIIVLALIFGGIVGVQKYQSKKISDKATYNNFNFYYDPVQGFWTTQIQLGRTPYNLPFYNHPADLEDIVVEEGVEDIIIKNRPKGVVIAVPGNSTAEMALAAIEISKITGERYDLLNIPTRSATNEPVEGLPYATCATASQDIVVISFERSSRNIISSEGRCIKLEFTNNQSIRVADAFAYRLLKIM